MAKLYNWYLSNYNEYILAHGIVTGHTKLADSTSIHTSDVRKVCISDNSEQVIIMTQNTKYFCDIKSMNKDAILNFIETNKNKFDWVKYLIKAVEIYDSINTANLRKYSVENNQILMVLGNNCEYYLKYFVAKKDNKLIEITRPDVHLGTFQDSVLFMPEFNSGFNFDLRYFPYQGNNIEFYSFEPEGMNVLIENCGDSTIRVKNKKEVYVIQPGERVEITQENAAQGEKLTNTSDLYPAIEL